MQPLGASLAYPGAVVRAITAAAPEQDQGLLPKALRVPAPADMHQGLVTSCCHWCPATSASSKHAAGRAAAHVTLQQVGLFPCTVISSARRCSADAHNAFLAASMCFSSASSCSSSRSLSLPRAQEGFLAALHTRQQFSAARAHACTVSMQESYVQVLQLSQKRAHEHGGKGGIFDHRDGVLPIRGQPAALGLPGAPARV